MYKMFKNKNVYLTICVVAKLLVDDTVNVAKQRHIKRN